MDDVSLDRRSELQKLYLNNMQEIKWRIEALDEIRFEKKTTRFFQTNIDFCVVQIRKILELIALSALVSDADIYKNKLGKIETMWNARLILQDIERIHPEFYPQPICQDSCDTNHWIDIKDDYLTKDRFIKIYDKCGKMLHARSPFTDDKTKNEEYQQTWDSVPQWRSWIIALLNQHIVKLYNQNYLYYIAMKGSDTGHPAGNIFMKVAEEKANEPHEI